MNATQPTLRRTKIVATIGPASSSPEVIRKLVLAGMDVARLNFSHGSYDDHSQVIKHLREISRELDTPVTILQDLQGPKVRVGSLPGGQIVLVPGEIVALVPEADFSGEAATIPIDYEYVAEEAQPGMQVLLADGIFEMKIVGVEGRLVRCEVVEGGVLKNRKGVNFPNLNLRLPSMTEKDLDDLAFGLEQGVDWVSLSFVRHAEDVRILKRFIADKGLKKPIIAKIEKPQAVTNLEEILDEVEGVMVARGDLGVEISAEKVPMLQKQIIESCNRRGLPVITATQMLESMIVEARPTRAETSDVANAIIDGTDAVMLSGESAMGAFPVRSVETMARIAREVEARIKFKTYPASEKDVARALTEAVNSISSVLDPKYIVVLTTTGYTAHFVAAQRPKAPVIAITTNPQAYHALNLVWGIRPLFAYAVPPTFEGLVDLAESTLIDRQLITTGDKILVLAGVPAGEARGSNFIKIHTVK
ncbi:MAG TPA: pyruvate kinase [Chthoniobacterales bacterium]